MNIYNHLNATPLQDFYSISIKHIEDGTPSGGKQVTFNSRIHVNTAVVFPVTYGTSFSDSQILSDAHLISWVSTAYGNVYA